MKTFGVIPAAGLGTRLSPLAFSKEMFPIGYQKYRGSLRPCPVSQYLVESMKLANVKDVFFIINSSKTDILSYYLDGQRFGMNFSYLIQSKSNGMVHALAQATPWLPKQEDYLITFGMPDTLFKPDSLYKSLIQKIKDKPNADIILGVFPTKAWHKLGMTTLKEKKTDFQVVDIIDKPKVKPETDYAWGIAAWTSKFQKFLSDYVKNYTDTNELVLGDVFSTAMKEGFRIYAVKGESYLDTGTTEDLSKAIEKMNKTGGV
ncbi:sugar phosphate nucleotidyltransferase [Terrilactibacillus laevilacticus]|uniref:Glucose-1-phosphate thymidylyltransferase n=1 Tax=Terrilactibacillus laevilacticus TaxID=1380157 RepID=A0ABW5PMR4_9BACI|nr:sugar phosphate nucleotidyltransferase [Terrilactibacillus laevilacticus]